MTKRIGPALCVLAAACITMAAQTEPVLSALNMPHYPWLARQARMEGIVKVTFTLQPKAKEPTKVEVISVPSTSKSTANELLKTAAVENVKTWRFQNVDAVEHSYVTTFDFQIAGEDEAVSFQSFHHVTVESGGGKIISN
jgi:TonB family protein